MLEKRFKMCNLFLNISSFCSNLIMFTSKFDQRSMVKFLSHQIYCIDYLQRALENQFCKSEKMLSFFIWPLLRVERVWNSVMLDRLRLDCILQVSLYTIRPMISHNFNWSMWISNLIIKLAQLRLIIYQNKKIC